MAYMRLGDLLVSSGIITGEQLEQALALPREDGQRLGDVLIRQGVISEAQLIDALRVQLGVDFVDLTAVSIPVELAKYVPRNLAKKFLVVPVKLVQDRLYLAMHDPLDFVAQDEVKTASRKRIIPMIATRKAVEQAIERLYGSEGTARVIEEMKREAGAGEDIIPAQMARDTADPEASAPTIRFVNSLIERAFTERASDIHLEPQEGEMLVRMRIDGLLQRVLTVPADLQNTVISRLKIMGGMNIAEHKVPQDGHAMFSVRGHSLDLRISSMPTVYGEKIVLRLLDKSAQVLDKSVLGLEGRDLDNYNALLKNTSGVVLLVGPTGSGKSTTMSNMLRDLSSDALNIVTLEDPVEYHLPGVNQCQINEKTGMTFASGLRAILRQDPDIIAVGEDRTKVTATYTAPGGETFTSQLPLVLPVRMQGVLGIANTSGEPSVYWQGVMDRDGTAFTDDVPSGAPYTDRPAYAGAKLYLYSRGSAATFDGLSVSGVTVKGGADATEYVLRPMPVSNDEDTSVLHPDVFCAENDDFRVTVGTPAKDTTSAFTYRPLTVKGRSQGQITLTVTLTDAGGHAFTLSIPYTLTEEDTQVTATLRVDEQAFTLSVPYGTAPAAEALSQLLTDNGISPDTIDSWTPDITQPLYADTAFTAVRKTTDSGGAPIVPDADTPASGSKDPEDTPSDDPSAPDSSSSGTDPTPEPSPDTLP